MCVRVRALTHVCVNDELHKKGNLNFQAFSNRRAVLIIDLGIITSGLGRINTHLLVKPSWK